jgi:hypothetical protein
MGDIWMAAISKSDPVADALKVFADRVKAKFSAGRVGEPEDQIRGPFETLLTEIGTVLGYDVIPEGEARVGALGRPDYGVNVDSLLNGYAEMKAPGIGVDPNKFKGHDKDQWGRYKEIPNLVYCDGNDFALYRTGERVRDIISISPDIKTKGKAAITEGSAREIQSLLQDYFSWEPIPPDKPEKLAKTLAPLCRLLREDVLTAISNENSALSQLAEDWRRALFPDADDNKFADAYAQALTYALLLARLDPATKKTGFLNTNAASEALQTGHALLAQTLRILADPQAKDEIGTAISMLERVISAVDPDKLKKDPEHDVWLYFYEDFLAAYDPVLRKDYGNYYTPKEVVHCQVNLVKELLAGPLEMKNGFASGKVIYLDPGVGTGTYPLGVIDSAVETIREAEGKGSIPGVVTTLANNLYAFEILVGPYAVAHLRLTQRITDLRAKLPKDGVRVYLTDTLESPEIKPSAHMPLYLRPLSEEHKKAARVKKDEPVLVCMGNPPYRRQTFDERVTDAKTAEVLRERLLGDFLKLAKDKTIFSHIASLYNDYVYFWRWALWKVFESKPGPGIVSFISAASYLAGPGFIGMREIMRRTFDELWIINLEGAGEGPRKTENIFSIETPVAVAIGIRYEEAAPDVPAKVHYCCFTGTREDKLKKLDSVTGFADIEWEDCPNSDWPRLIDIFPWQQPGIMMGRTWPKGTLPSVLEKRWDGLVSSDQPEKEQLFPDRDYGRRITSSLSPTYPKFPDGELISEASTTSLRPPVVRYGYRSFDRQWLLADPRLLDLQRPALWYCQSDSQVYLCSLLTNEIGYGPAATTSAHICDKHYFRGSYGGKDVIPLWRDPDAAQPNITQGLLKILFAYYGSDVSPEALFSYCYGILSCVDYTQRFFEELKTSSIRIPLTADADTFEEVTKAGHRMIWLHTYGERFTPEGEKPGTIPSGEARSMIPIPVTPDEYPDRYDYDEETGTLLVGVGTFGPISRDVWEFEISGMNPLHKWLSYRMKDPSGRISSPLDKIGPDTWPNEFTTELLQLLWVLEATIGAQVELSRLLDDVLNGPLIPATELPIPDEDQRKEPKLPKPAREDQGQLEFEE